MNLFKFFIAVLRTYDYRDKLATVAAFAILLLMVVKMMIFPYGFFHFGESNIYTEGLVSKNGIQNLNPLFVDFNEADREISRLLFSGLMKYDIEKKAIVDDMATLTINEDKTKYTFKIRPGIKWHDGQDFTADDVYYTFHDVIMADNFPNEILKTNFTGVEVKEIDKSSVEFVLEKPNTFFVSNMTIGILPKHILQNTDPADLVNDDFNKMPVGTGPYIMTSPVESYWGGRMQVTLEVDSNHYDALPKIQYMRFLVYPTMEDLMDELNALNGVVKVTGGYLDQFKSNKRFTLIPYELPQYTGVFFNLDNPILSIDKVRLALQKSIDKDALVKEFEDKVRVDTPLLEKGDEKDAVFKPDPDMARGALKDSGYNYGPDDVQKLGIRYGKDETALQFTLIARLYDEGTYQFEETKKVLEFLQRAWESIGVGINVELLSVEQFEERIMNRQYDLLFVGHNLGYNLDNYSYWHSTQSNPLGQNFSNYKSFRVDSLIEDIRSVFNQDKRDRELTELADQIKKDIPAIFLYRPVSYYATDGKVSGIAMDGAVFPADCFSNIAKWIFER